MKKLLLTTLLIFGTAIVHGQDKMQFSIIGGSVPVIHSYRPTVEMGTKNTYLLRYATSISIGYDYRVSKSFSIGLNYTGWWVADVAYRNTLNAKIGYNF